MAAQSIPEVLEYEEPSVRPVKIETKIYELDWSQTTGEKVLEYDPAGMRSVETMRSNQFKDSHIGMRLATCEVGSIMRFRWEGLEDGSNEDFLYLMDTEEDYVTCNFAKALKLEGKKMDGSTLISNSRTFVYDFNCGTERTMWLLASKSPVGSNIGKTACHFGKKLRLQVTDLSKTEMLRSMANPLNGNKPHYTVATTYRDFILDADFKNQGFKTNELAKEAQDALWCVEPHSWGNQSFTEVQHVTQKPDGSFMNHGEMKLPKQASCLDWFSEDFLKKQHPNYCQALVETDIGFSYRKRPTPEFKKALEYYDKGLELMDQNYCAAQAYKAGLFAQRVYVEKWFGDSGRKKEAQLEYEKACEVCGGEWSMEMEGLSEEWRKYGMLPACDSACRSDWRWGEGCEDNFEQASSALSRGFSIWLEWSCIVVAVSWIFFDQVYI